MDIVSTQTDAFTCKSLLFDHAVGSLGHDLLQGLGAHPVQPMRFQGSPLSCGSKRLNKGVQLWENTSQTRRSQ